ncbi:YhgE/Pip family protein [Salinibacterium sp.]|uniref:YhgE/Pip family protein n=1 Tax=Salinibacterium sp. TaxID=1915057 RepID=UPI00286CF237|nr:YhgE/Pip family protein [Salinibacterium sp.]
MTTTTVLRRIGFAAVALVPLAFAGLFVGATSQGNKALDNIPVAIVNNDTLQKSTAADGTEQPVFAGRLLVSELTGAEGFDWTITNGKDAAAALDAGEVYAVLTVPSNFSTSLLSLSSDAPQQADISIRTDDSHGYLTGSVAQVVGQTMTDTFGKTITAQYIGGIYASIGDLGASLSTAADGATQLSSGASSLSTGLGQYTAGVGSLASGLGELSDGASGLNKLSDGIGTYTGGVSQLSAALSQLTPAIEANPTVDPAISGGLRAITNQLAGAAAGGATLSSEAASGIDGVRYGISQSAEGAAQLSVGGPALVSGASGLATGATSLATGLQSGADQVPATDPEAAASSAKIAANPVTLSVSTANMVSDLGQAVATFAIPLGLWVGALAVFLVLRPVTRRALASTARSGRLVSAALGRAGIITGAQAILLVALLHGVLGVGWNVLPATLGFSLLTALAFTAFHLLLTVSFGRGGLVVSLFLLAIQLTSTGGIYPIQLLSAPYQAVSPLLPLTYAVDGMQGIITGGNPGSVIMSVAMLLVFGAGSALLSLVALRRTRRARSLGLLPSVA